MKTINIKIQKILLISMLLISSITNAQFTPITLNTVINTDSSNGFKASIPSEVLSGDNIILNITLPPTGCDVDMSIAYSSPNNKIQYVSSTSLFDFSNVGNTTTNDNPIATGNDGKNFNLFFKFPNYITCNGEVATFEVTFTTCTGIYTTTVSTIARAANYWTVRKYFDIGNSVCGISKWYVYIKNNNPNPSGFGGYKIQGTVTENPSAPYTVVGSSVQSVNLDNSKHLYFYLNNCGNTGDIITNTVDYNFTLGDGCDTMSGTKTADSTPLQIPTPTLDFRKWVSSGGISPGCSGSYTLYIANLGNVPLQINSVTDTIPTSKITISSVNPSSFINNNNPITSSIFTFTAPTGSPVILQPNQSKYITFDFTVNPGVAIGTVVSNTAYINYNAIGTSTSSSTTSTSTACTGTCPPIDEGILNDDDSTIFTVVAPRSKEIFSKTITNKPIGNIYNIGDIVHFRLRLGNGGAGNLSTTITDYLGLPNQNLNIMASSFTYTYYENQPYNGSNNPQPITFGITPTINANDLSIAITNMPGTCEYNEYNILKIEFDAVVLTQIYGNKTNIAYTSNNNEDSANYTIDQFGVLAVNKRADREFVENGAAFNYIIEVSNNGSVPLDHITITDNLPSCVSIMEGMQITDFANNTISSTQSGLLNITVDPNAQIMPGQKFTITVPVIKNGGGNCCNESVTATGTMTTSGVVLDAIFGSEIEPAACVKSIECCDIPDFEANLYENADGSYSVSINGGAVPIQQVDVSVIDYHVEYNQKECQPQDMGAFGQLSTNTIFLDGLALETTTNNTSNLTWLPGDPAIMDASLDFNINKPNVLDLECCNVDFNFCIKVTVKDVNCNVCEKIICPEPFIEPCNISVENIESSYCTNDSITINWTGDYTSGNVDIYLVQDGGGTQIQIASSQLESGNLNWNIPVSIQPCDSNWKIVINDSKNKECLTTSNVFMIECCSPKCSCGDWKSKTIKIQQKIEVIDHDFNSNMFQDKKSQNKNMMIKPIGQFKVECGGDIELKKGTYQMKSPIYVCNPSDCRATYTWILKNLETGQISHGTSNNFNYTFDEVGKFNLMFIPFCGGNECGACQIYINIKK